jgi:thiol:disulfide interchange protein DsbG
MHQIKHYSMLAAKATLFSTIAISAVSAMAADSTSKYPATVQTVIDSGLKLRSNFDAAGGLKGWILSNGPGQHVIVYTSQDGEVAIAGNMFDAKGTSFNPQYIEKYLPKPDYEKFWGDLASSAWVAQGPETKDAKSIMYVFEDANCGFCHLTWKALDPYTKVGLQIRWVPVAFLAPDSMPKATALLAAKDSNAAIAESHANFGKKLEDSAPVVDGALKAKVEANGKLMDQWEFSGTPVLVYKDKDGKVRTKAGVPPLSELPTMTGLAEQANNDPALAKYR